jgi:hypothetical protein
LGRGRLVVVAAVIGRLALAGVEDTAALGDGRRLAPTEAVETS